MITPFPYPGGKTRLAYKYAMKLAQHMPRQGQYYEGFCGAASVATQLGHLRPDIMMALTDTNPHVIRALVAIRDRGADLAKGVISFINTMRLAPDPDEMLRIAQHSSDPVLWLAGMQARYPGEMFTWNWNPDEKRLDARIKNLSDAFAQVAKGLKNSVILCQPCGVRECDAAFFDPPYHGSKKIYPFAQGMTEIYAHLFERQREVCKYILIADYSTADYKGFVREETGAQLGGWSKEGSRDTYFEWARSVPSGSQLGSAPGESVQEEG